MAEINLLDNTAPVFDTAVYDILEHRHTQYVFKGGRGSTKSSFISELLFVLMDTDPRINILVLRQYGNTLKDSVFNQVCWAMDMLDIADSFKVVRNPLEITRKRTNQKIYFRGADDPQKIKSIKPEHGYIGVVWFEELDQFDGAEAIRSILQSTNRGGDKFWNFFSFNPPKSRDNWANIFALETRSDRLTIHSTYLDVPADWLGAQFFIDAEHLKSTNELAYRHEYLGEATGTGGSVFDNINARTITDEEISSLGYFYYGIDFGFAIDPFVWLKLSYDRPRNKLYILDEIYQCQLSNERAVELIKQRQSAGQYITADSAEPKSISEMNDRGLKVIGARKGVGSVEYGLSRLQHCDEIVIDPARTPNAHREFTTYEYDRDRNGNFISRFPDKDNHTIDAARYALETVFERRKVGVMDKTKLGAY